MRVAILEASHWHVPLYLEALETPGLEVVAVSDLEQNRGKAIADRFGARLYTGYDELLERESVDFAFAFGRHAAMPRIGEALISRNVPFALEKPCGIRAADVSRLRDLARTANVYVAVPFILRLSDLHAALEQTEGRLPSDFAHISFRFMAGPPSRYEAAGSAWALDPAQSGGGPTCNVGTHFIDFFRLLTGKEVVSVSATMSSRLHRREIEDYSLVTMTTADGVIGVVETGYTFPSTADEQREFSFTIASRRAYAKSGPDRIEIRQREDVEPGTRSIRIRTETDVYYPAFVKRVLADWQAGKPPIAGLEDAAATMRIIDAAYASARQGGAPVILESTR
jgi:predicted dehydrogenase